MYEECGESSWNWVKMGDIIVETVEGHFENEQGKLCYKNNVGDCEERNEEINTTECRKLAYQNYVGDR